LAFKHLQMSLTCVQENAKVTIVFLTGVFVSENTSALRAYPALKERIANERIRF
jgi:hypothetical protein